MSAFVIQSSLALLFVVAGSADSKVEAQEEKLPRERPINVKPVLDDLPLLKLGGKKPKLPDIWKKLPPVPVKRFEEKSAPSEKAEDNPEAIPTSELAKGDAEAPPPDAELAKKVDEMLTDATAPDAKATVEGAALLMASRRALRRILSKRGRSVSIE